MYDKFHHVPGLDIQEKALGPAVPYIFRFSCQPKYFSEKREKHEKVVTSEEISQWQPQGLQHRTLCIKFH